MKRIICYLKKHKAGNAYYRGGKVWHVECLRCGFKLDYHSPHARLMGTETKYGF